MEDTFHYKKVADLLHLKPHSVRAYCSVNKINSKEMPKETVIELLEGRIKRLETYVRTHFDLNKSLILSIVRKSYGRITGRSLDIQVEEVKVQIPEEIKPVEKVVEKTRSFSSYPKLSIDKCVTKPLEKPLKKSRIRSELNSRERNMPLDNLVDLIKGQINKVKKELKGHPDSNKEKYLENLEQKYRSIYTVFKQRKENIFR